jgi:hypothetical protein
MNGYEGPVVTVERGRRGAGRRLGEQTSFQMDHRMANLLRIMKANGDGSVADIVREAIARGLPKMPGYTKALAQYNGGRRVDKAPATGGRAVEVPGADE